MSAVPARVLHAATNGTWKLARLVNSTFAQGQLPHPAWAPSPLLKSHERMFMATGVPRKTLSLCPGCNGERIDAVINGGGSTEHFRNSPGVIEAEILEEAGRILIRKSCDRHGPFEDVLSNHPDFFKRMESLAFGRDFRCSGDEAVHNHGVNSIRSGRGAFLVIDLTNRCNMVCSPCFMDANAKAYVHEVGFDAVKGIFGRAVSFKPRREINILFSGGEPTLSPIFVDAIRYAKNSGFHRIHVATNGIQFAKDREFVFAAREAGLHGVYLQVDGMSDAMNEHRGIANYMELKHRALENIAAVGMRATLQVTVTNGWNNNGLGDIVRFAIQNPEKIHGIAFQPIMFAGRDENISNDERYARRYPVSQIAYDLQEQTSIDCQPMRDWFPLSAYGLFGHLCDVLTPDAELGSLFNDTHPDHGVFCPLLTDSLTQRATPLAAFFNMEQFMRDIVEITDSGRSPLATKALLSLSVLRNFDSDKAPAGFGVSDARRLLEDCFYRIAGGSDDWSQRAYSYRGRWRLLMVNTVLFQDLYMYDLSTISDSTYPVGMEDGEISFCAYNGGRWRNIVEHNHKTASLAEWHQTHSRHEIYAKGKTVAVGQGKEIPNRLVQIDREPANRSK
jgi:7,8-dihydro-6-hydroxymethylpterin dimethyltransferase